MSNDKDALAVSIDGMTDRITEALDGIGNEICGAFTGEPCIDGFTPNVVSVITDLADATKRAAAAITPNVSGSTDATGGHVESLTEAVMGTTAGLCRIAESLDGIASAINSLWKAVDRMPKP